MHKQAVVRKHNKPRPRVAHRGIARFLGIDQKCNQVPEFHANRFSGFLVMLLTKKLASQHRAVSPN